MENPEQLDLEVHKLINDLYKMRYFITAPILQAQNFNIWLYLRDEQQQLINNEHLLIISQFSLSFKTLFTDQDHINSFIEKLLGEEVGYKTYHSGLMQNKPQSLYYFFINPANNAIKEFLMNNLYTLNHAYNDWQIYQDEHAGLEKLINKCIKEINKKCTRNETLKLWHSVTKNIQHTINKANLPVKTKSRSQPLIHLNHPEELPILNQFIRKINSTSIEVVLNHVQSLIKLRYSFNALMETAYLEKLLILDKCIFQCLFHNTTNINAQLINHYVAILNAHLHLQLQPYSAHRTSDPKGRDEVLTKYLKYAQNILDLSHVYLSNYFCGDLSNMNINLIVLISEINQQMILENDPIVDADEDNEIPNTQGSNSSQPADDYPSTQEDPPLPQQLAENLTTITPQDDSLKSDKSDSPPDIIPNDEKPDKQSLKRTHPSEKSAAISATDVHDVQPLKKSRSIHEDVFTSPSTRPIVQVGARRLNSDMPEQLTLALTRRGLFPAPPLKRCQSSPAVIENQSSLLTQFV